MAKSLQSCDNRTNCTVYDSRPWVFNTSETIPILVGYFSFTLFYCLSPFRNQNVMFNNNMSFELQMDWYGYEENLKNVILSQCMRVIQRISFRFFPLSRLLVRLCVCILQLIQFSMREKLQECTKNLYLLRTTIKIRFLSFSQWIQADK